MDHHHHHRSTAPIMTHQKLNISYLLNDPTSDEKSDVSMREAASTRDLRPHRLKAMPGSSTRRLNLSSASLRDRHSSSSSTTTTTMPSFQQAAMFTCPYCKEGFSEASLFDQHKKSHQITAHHSGSSQRSTRSFKCDQCGSSFSEKGNLNRHIKSVHKKEKPWPCQFCSSHFAFRDALNRHVDAVHLDLRPYSCDQCVAKFKKRAHLQRHVSSCHRSTNQQK